MSTVSMTVNPHVTSGIGVPLAVYLRFPQGNLFGKGHQADQHRQILTDVLKIRAQAEAPETIVALPYRWRDFRNT